MDGVKTPSEAVTWINLIGVPMHRDLEAIKRMIWLTFGGGTVAGTLFGLLAPVLLKKLGWL